MKDDVTNYVAWNELKGKEARGTGDLDLGEVQEIGRNYIVTKKGRVSKEKFYIPKYLSEGYDGHTLYFNVAEAQLRGFGREAAPSYEEYGNHLAFNLVYSDKCLECNDGKCRYDAKDLVYYCKTNTRQVNGIHDKGVDDIVYWW